MTDLAPSGATRRLEVLAGPERRRRYSASEKSALVAETLRPGACAAQIARRHGLHPQQVYPWRRQARRGASRRVIGTPLTIDPKTVAKWRKRASVDDAPMGPRERRSSVLSKEEVVTFRRHTLLPLDDWLYALQAIIPHPPQPAMRTTIRLPQSVSRMFAIG